MLPAVPKVLAPVYMDSADVDEGTGILHILVVDSELSNRILLTSVLIGLGHSVVHSSNGLEAYNEITSSASDPFDLVIMDMEVSEGWDGLQAVRMIRHWERETSRPDHLVIVGTAPSLSFVLERNYALSAGFDEFMMRPFKNYVEGEPERVDFVETLAGDSTRWTTKSIDTVQEEDEREEYEAFVERILKYLRQSKSMQEIVSLYAEPLQATAKTPLPSEEVLATIPGPLISSRFVLSGTLGNINIMLRTLYYFPPNGTLTVGDAILTITAEDTLPECTSFESISDPTLSMRDAPTSANASSDLCNIRDASGSSTASIRIVVTGKNQAPEISITREGLVTARLDAVLSIDFVALSDPDFDDVSQLTDSFGFEQLPPVTAKVSAGVGYVYFEQTDDVSLLVSSTDMIVDSKRVLEIYGPIDKINTALASLKYICSGESGCIPGLLDSIKIEVDDGGYIGQGGPLQSTSEIEISVV